VARTSLVNYIDETSWLLHGDRQWLWVMANPAVAYFQIHTHRSKAVFMQLIHDWRGILVSDGYRVYQYWEGLRQSCLAHLIRAAKGLAESVEVGMGRFGRRVHTELQRLCHMGTERPTVGQWGAWYARFHALLNQYATRQDKAGTLARRLAREGEVLWMFLDVQGVEATNNIAGVRFVDQKPALNKAWGIDPERKSSDAQALENLIPVSVGFRPPLVRG